MPKSRDPQSDPHVLDKPNDPAPTKGTEEPWKRPGQSSQNPDEKEPEKPDLEKWHKSSTH